jgi:hypothetical protein
LPPYSKPRPLAIDDADVAAFADHSLGHQRPGDAGAHDKHIASSVTI